VTNAPTPESLPVPYGDGVNWSASVTGTCLDCTNGIVTDAPRFTLNVYASYVGRDRSNQTVGGTSPTRSIGLPNNPGYVGTPCPF